MNDKKRIRCEIVTYLCGDEELSDEFVELLKAGNLSKNDGKIIREKLMGQIDSNYNFDILFGDYYREQLKSPEDYPADEMKAYTGDEQYLELLNRHFPQSVKEACDILISMLDEDDIRYIKESDKFRFGINQHFGLGLFIRNHFGINQRQSRSLNSDIYEKSGEMLLMADNKSGFILDELWEEVQRRY